MSGICGLFNLDGAPVRPDEIRDMASLLTRRGPDRTSFWRNGSVGLGHTLLATTPEAQLERLPFHDDESGCSVTGDVRLDNRRELLLQLRLGERADAIGDGELVLRAYLAWGETSVERLLGDFAFAIWDSRNRKLFCARDHIGMRLFCFHYRPGRFFVFATEPRAILVLPQVPYRINEGRIADYLVEGLEGIDKTSTFFEGVFRLPPAHAMSVTPAGTRQWRYWTLEPRRELDLSSAADFGEAFLDVFREAVSCRLRTVGPAGSMLSGGVDSGTIVTVARELLKAGHQSPLLTFSAVSPDGDDDPETRAIKAATGVGGIEPHFVTRDRLDRLLPELVSLMWASDEPFDGYMNLVRAVYLAARQEGLTSILDGVAGDVVLSEGRYLARLMRRGKWATAHREAVGRNHYWKGAYPPVPELLRSTRPAFVPDVVLSRLRLVRQRLVVGNIAQQSFVSAEFARRVGLAERLRAFESRRSTRPLSRGGIERAREIESTYVTVGRERYDRVAAAIPIEPRDPFLDVRVLEFCVRLPDDMVVQRGWPKVILRYATEGKQPDAVRWRNGKEHLGWAFTQRVMNAAGVNERYVPDLTTLGCYIDALDDAPTLAPPRLKEGFAGTSEGMYSLAWLSTWLRGNAERPVPLRIQDPIRGRS